MGRRVCSKRVPSWKAFEKAMCEILNYWHRCCRSSHVRRRTILKCRIPGEEKRDCGFRECLVGQVCWQEWICQLSPDSSWLAKLSWNREKRGGGTWGSRVTRNYLEIILIQLFRGSFGKILKKSIFFILYPVTNSKPFFNFKDNFFLPSSKDPCLFNYLPLTSRNQVVWKFGQGTYGADLGLAERGGPGGGTSKIRL